MTVEPTTRDRATRRVGRRGLLLLLGGAASLTLALDAVSKHLVIDHLTGRAPVTVVPGVLDLELTRNPGAAFSLGTGSTVVFTVVALAVAGAIVRLAPRLTSRAWALVLGLLLGGALGNLADRVFRAPGVGRGEVVDWIHLHHWPVFNIADSAITVGGVLAVVLSLRNVSATGLPGAGSSDPGRPDDAG